MDQAGGGAGGGGGGAVRTGMDSNSKLWFTTSFTDLPPESDARSVGWTVGKEIRLGG